MQKNIALIEDDLMLRQNYISVLEKQGYRVSAYSNRSEAEAALRDSLPDLAIIDIGLGDDVDAGFAICQLARSLSKTLPIIFFTARDNDYDTICGLRMGADDYLTKDISLPHLLARISALFRRVESMQSEPAKVNLINLDRLQIDLNCMVVNYANQIVDLTVTEFWMLHAIVKHPGHVKSRQQLMEDSKMVVDDTTITSHIKRIRRKFNEIEDGFDRIETVYGMGYRWKLLA